ncbi:MAG: ROK family protein [Bryobacteraceae bacterium]|nr:ROK family protein [Bryobacteraceae bacterium]
MNETQRNEPVRVLADPLAIRNGYVIGADIGGTNLRLALADASGCIVARRRVSTQGVRDAGTVVRMLCESSESLLREAAVPRPALRALGVGAPGITDAGRGIVIATSYLMGWRDVPLRDVLESALGIPVAVENDVNAAAIGEARAGVARGVDDFAFLAIGTGIGAGIVLNRRLHRGHGWTAGEIGYMLVPGTSEAPVKRGDPGALEELAGGDGIGRQWRGLWRADLTTLSQSATATEIFDHALAGNALANAVLQSAARGLSYAIYNMALVLNVPLFVLGGSVGLHPALGDAARAFLEQRDARANFQLVRSSLGDQAQLTGAVHLALDAAAAQAPIGK